MKKMFRMTVLSAIATLALAATTGYSQVSNTMPTMPKSKGNGNSFRMATVASVDPTAKTVTIKNRSLGERVLNTDTNSTLVVDGKPGTLADIKTGYYAHGTLHMVGTNDYITKAFFDKERPMRPGAGGTNGPAKMMPPQ